MSPNSGLSKSQQAFLQELRTVTRPLHDALEQSPLSSRIVASDITRAEYTAYLQRMYALHAQAEAALIPMVQELFVDIQERKRSHHAAEDLQQLNSEPDASLVWQLAQPQNIYEALGMMYVLEGSSLGGRVIIKNIQSSPFAAAQAYFNGYGSDTGAMWVKFLHTLTPHADDARTRASIITGANKAYHSVRELLSLPFDKGQQQ